MQIVQKPPICQPDKGVNTAVSLKLVRRGAGRGAGRGRLLGRPGRTDRSVPQSGPHIKVRRQPSQIALQKGPPAACVPGGFADALMPLMAQIKRFGAGRKRLPVSRRPAGVTPLRARDRVECALQGVTVCADCKPNHRTVYQCRTQVLSSSHTIDDMRTSLTLCGFRQYKHTGPAWNSPEVQEARFNKGSNHRSLPQACILALSHSHMGQSLPGHPTGDPSCFAGP